MSALVTVASATGWAIGCGGRLATLPADAPDASAVVDTGVNAQCPTCLTDNDCNGDLCAQFSGDAFCVPRCPNGNECTSDRSCITVSTSAGASTNGCVPRGDVCGPSTSAVDAGSPSKCGTLVGPDVTASCNGCGAHTCQPNGCYTGWWCDTAGNRCRPPPTSCTGGGGGGVGYDGGAPVTGQIGPDGGTESRLFFAVIGDTRPANVDDTAGYPTAIITKIFADLAAFNPLPPFAVSTGDYMFAAANGTEAAPQLDMYLAARAKYSGLEFPAMGNHECNGYTASNCGAGNADGITVNYTTFLSKFLGQVKKTVPYYEIDVAAPDASWTSKFLFVAANAWNNDQLVWLDTAMHKTTTYTFIVRHEPANANTAPGVIPSEAIMAKYPYTLAIVGHSHTYSHSMGTREVVIGNGGAPITTGGKNYGFAIVNQQADGTLAVDMIDYMSGLADPSFHFAVKPDGSAAP